jgi:hypothetical protein
MTSATAVLMREQRSCGLAGSVVGERERAFRIGRGGHRGRGEQRGDRVGVGGYVFEVAGLEQPLDDLTSLVPPRHGLQDTESRPMANCEPAG